MNSNITKTNPKNYNIYHDSFPKLANSHITFTQVPLNFSQHSPTMVFFGHRVTKTQRIKLNSDDYYIT